MNACAMCGGLSIGVTCSGCKLKVLMTLMEEYEEEGERAPAEEGGEKEKKDEDILVS